MSNKKDLTMECFELIIWLEKIANEAAKLNYQIMFDEIADSNKNLAIILGILIESVDDSTKANLLIKAIYVVNKALQSNLLSK